MALVWIAQHPAIGAYHQRELVVSWRQPGQQRDGVGILLGIERGMRKGIAPKEVLQAPGSRIARPTEQDDAVAALEHQHPSQDQRPDDGLADVRLVDHQLAQFVGTQQHRFDILDHAGIDDGRLVRQLRDIGGELPAAAIDVDGLPGAQSIAAGDPHLARQQQEHAGAWTAGPVQIVAGGEVAQRAEASHPFDVGVRQHRKHLVKARMIAHAAIGYQRAVIVLRLDLLSRACCVGRDRRIHACSWLAARYARADRSISFSIVIGRSRTRLPVAWWTALATAAANPVMPISPIPRAPNSLNARSG